MKEQMTYVAIDADNVGESIGNAVLSNDTEQLSSISDSINSGVAIFSQWAEYNGGKVISSGSDEAIFQVPVTSLDDLEKLKTEYQEKTGFSISVGIGENVSDAAKALIYAKMNGKDQIMDYSPEMERAMKESISGELNEEVEDEDQLEGGVGDDVDSEDLPQDELEEGTEHEKEHTDDEEIAEEIAEDHLAEDDDYYSDLEEMEEEDEQEDTEEIEVPADQVDGDYGSEEMEEAQPEHEKEMSEEEEFVHDAEENREDELDEDIIEADEEEEFLDEEMEEEVSEDEALDEMVDAEDSAEEDIDLDGRPDVEEEHGAIDPEQDDLDDDGDVEHEEAMAVEADEEEEYDDTEDYDDEIVDDEELENSIAEEMGIEEQEMMEEAPVEEPGAEEPLDHEDLKSAIYESLNIFRQNRDYLNAMGQENPELYSSLIHTLQAMIEMAKELGYGDAAEEMMEEAPEAQAIQEMPEEMEGYEKSEVYTRLIGKMRKAFELLKSDDVKSMEEVKEAIKKKKEQAKKGDSKKISKKKKPSVKKPKVIGKKKKKVEEKGDNDGSFCAKSHKKMRAAGKDCRSNEDKNSPLCSARKKFNCRGKNEEKGKSIEKNEGESKIKGADKFIEEANAAKKTNDVFRYARAKHGVERANKVGQQKDRREKEGTLEDRSANSKEEKRGEVRQRKSEGALEKARFENERNLSDEAKQKVRAERKKKGTKQKGVHLKEGDYLRDKKAAKKKAAQRQGERKDIAKEKAKKRAKYTGDKSKQHSEAQTKTFASSIHGEQSQESGQRKGVKAATGKQVNVEPEKRTSFRRESQAGATEWPHSKVSNIPKSEKMVYKSEKLAKFLKKKELLKVESGNKGRQGTTTKLTGTYSNEQHVPVPTRDVGSVKNKKLKIEDPETGNEKIVDASGGLAMGPDGNPLPAPAPNPLKGKKPKSVKAVKQDKA
jgi:hypothetical protein